MKKFLNILGSVAIVAAILSGCVRNDENLVNPVSKKRVVTIMAGADETRTVLDEANMRVLWDENDYHDMQLIEVGRNGDGEFKELQRAYATGIELIDGGKTAKFTFELDDVSDKGCTEFAYRAIMIYDDDELVPGEMSDYYIKNSQDPTPTTFDPRADILIAKPQGPFTESQSSLDFYFARAVAITKMTLTGLEAGSLIRSVSFITDEDHGTPIVGEVQPTYDADGNCTLSFVGDITGYDNHRVTMSYLDRELKADGSFDVYFVIAPVTLQHEKYITIRVVTTDKCYEKEIQLKSDLKFSTDKINRLTVDMEDTEYTPEADALMLVTNASQLQIGDKFIIVNSEAGKAISTSQNANNRAATDIIIDKSTNIAQFNPNVQIFELQQGVKDDTFAIYATNGTNTGYICAASNSKNYLYTTSNLDESASWTISIEATGNATIKAQSYTRNWLKYNPNVNNGVSNPIFSCYGSGQNDVQIFHYEQSLPVVLPMEEPQYVGFAASDYKINYKLVKGVDDFKVVEVFGCVKSAYIGTPGTITVKVDKNTTETEIEGSVIIASKAHPDITAKIQIIQNAAGLITENTASVIFAELGYKYQEKITTVNAIKNIVELTFAKSNGSNDPVYYDPAIRVYNNNTITFTPADGITITQIKMHFTGAGQMGGNPSTFGSGSYERDYDNLIGTWTGATNSPIIYQNLNVQGATTQARITKIEVTYY